MDDNEDEDSAYSAEAYVRSESMSVHRSLFTTQLGWCSFQGVTCGSVSGTSSYANVIAIDLFNQGLSGSLPSQIGSFGKMLTFGILQNGITGSIPSSISAMTSLAYFTAASNSLTGSIPSNIIRMNIRMEAVFVSISHDIYPSVCAFIS